MVLVSVDVNVDGTLSETSLNEIYPLLAAQCPQLEVTPHPSESWLLISEVLEWLSADAWQMGDQLNIRELSALWERYYDGELSVTALDARVR